MCIRDRLERAARPFTRPSRAGSPGHAPSRSRRSSARGHPPGGASARGLAPDAIRPSPRTASSSRSNRSIDAGAARDPTPSRAVPARAERARRADALALVPRARRARAFARFSRTPPRRPPSLSGGPRGLVTRVTTTRLAAVFFDSFDGSDATDRPLPFALGRAGLSRARARDVPPERARSRAMAARGVGARSGADPGASRGGARAERRPGAVFGDGGE